MSATEASHFTDLSHEQRHHEMTRTDLTTALATNYVRRDEVTALVIQTISQNDHIAELKNDVEEIKEKQVIDFQTMVHAFQHVGDEVAKGESVATYFLHLAKMLQSSNK
jgi:hypothetical protein